MEYNNNFFKEIYNDDIIYHYTKASTAIDYILYNNELKFNKARQSNDPIESKKPDRRTVYYDSEIDKPRTLQRHIDENELHNFVNDLEEQFSHICFCQNRMGEDFASQYYMSGFEGHEELFGFTKLRMWDQYADRFSGVCLALSKSKILSLNDEKFNLIEGEVKYLTFQDLLVNKVGDIQGNHLAKVGKEVYKQQLEKLVKDSFFCKHTDYSGEAEYRIGTLFDKTKCSLEIIRDEMVFDRTMMLDILNCMKAIFFSSFANKRQKNDLLEYANKLDVPIFEMQWKHDSFELRDYRWWIELIKDVQSKTASALFDMDRE